MKIQEAMSRILDMFKSGDIPQAIAYSTFPPADIPCEQWSFFNRLLINLFGTFDARGYRQWQDVGRYVKRGAKAIPILAPRMVKSKDDTTDDAVPVLQGFLAVPVFRYEDTDGEPLEYKNIRLPELPLYDVAMRWGLSVTGIPRNATHLGYYSDAAKEIALATPAESVFFHELAHAAHYRLADQRETPRWAKEIVAEFSAASLALLTGRQLNIGNHFQYIEHYAREGRLSTLSACMKLMGCVEKVLIEITTVPAH